MKIKNIYFALLMLLSVFIISCSTTDPTDDPIEGLQYRLGSYSNGDNKVVIGASTISIVSIEYSYFYSLTIDLNTDEYKKTDVSLTFYNIAGTKYESGGNTENITFTSVSLKFKDHYYPVNSGEYDYTDYWYTVLECLLVPSGESSVEFSCNNR